MDYTPVHNFNVTISEMKIIQDKLRKGIIFRKLEYTPKIISGVDAIYTGNKALCLIVNFDFISKRILEITYGISENFVDYKAGLLAFHELPPFLKAWSQLTIEPDLVVFDGYGYTHPMRMGLATHASFFIQKPTFGIAKTPFIGEYTNPDNLKGSFTYIMDKGEKLGVSLKTNVNKKPVYVSVGNYCSLEEAISISLDFTLFDNRIPELTRVPDLFSKKLKGIL